MSVKTSEPGSTLSRTLVWTVFFFRSSTTNARTSPSRCKTPSTLGCRGHGFLGNGPNALWSLSRSSRLRTSHSWSVAGGLSAERSCLAWALMNFKYSFCPSFGGWAKVACAARPAASRHYSVPARRQQPDNQIEGLCVAVIFPRP